MARQHSEIFPKDVSKTYGLMELVRGTSPQAERPPERTAMSWPHLLIVELIVFLGVVLFVVAWGVFQDAPLRELANPDVTENPAKAPWYFLGLQELLLHMHPSLAGVIIPTAVIVALMALPYIDRNTGDVGIWFASRKGKQMALFSAFFAGVLVVALILFDEYIGVRAIISGPDLVTGWVIPLLLIGVLSGLLVLILQFWHPTLREIIVGLFSAFVITTVILTLSGTTFRGLGMHLFPPLEIMRDPQVLTGPLLAAFFGVLLLWGLKELPRPGRDEG